MKSWDLDLVTWPWLAETHSATVSILMYAVHRYTCTYVYTDFEILSISFYGLTLMPKKEFREEERGVSVYQMRKLPIICMYILEGIIEVKIWN